MPRGITERDVFSACDALLLTGERPTIERVRQKIGRGSPNTVSPILDAWFKGLGRRLQDPGAFAPPPDVPDQVLQAAQHFWEVAQSIARSDLDERLRAGLAAASASAEAEKDRADRAASEALAETTKATALGLELNEQTEHLAQARRDLAAERARIEGVRSTLEATQARLREREATSAAALAEADRQLTAALERADAADLRVALELERERVGRAKADKQVETLQKALTTSHETATAASERAQALLTAARDREQVHAALRSATAAELSVERERLKELRVTNDAAAADAAAARAQVARLQASLDRLASLVESGAHITQPTRKRKPRPSPSAG